MIRKGAFVLSLFVASTAIHEAQAIYWDTFNGQTSGFLLNDNNNTWDQARQQSGTVSYLGATGHLATIHSTAENTLVTLIGRNRGTRSIGMTDSTATSTLDGYNAAALGTSESGTNGNLPLPPAGVAPVAGQKGFGWKWVTNEPYTYQNWAGGEPNDSSGEDAGQVRNDGLWNDDDAGSTLGGEANDNFRSVIEFNPANAPLSKWQTTTYKVQDVQIPRATVTTLAEAKQVIAGTRALPAGTPQLLEPSFNGGAPLTQAVSNINFVNNATNQGFFTPDNQYPGLGVGSFTGDQNQFVIRATGNFTATTGGLYTFGVNSDDGFGLIIRDAANNVVGFQDWSGQSGTGLASGELTFAAGRGHNNTATTTSVASYGRINLAAGAQYNFELVHWEGDGGTAVLESYWMLGSPTDYAPNATGTNLSFSDGTWTLLGNPGDLVASNLQATTYKLYNQVNYADINNITDAQAVIAGTFSAPLADLNPFVAGNNTVTGFTDVFNMIDNSAAAAGTFHQYGQTGLLGNDTPLGAGGFDDFVVRSTGFVQVDASGVWTFGVAADDGYLLRLDLDNNGSYETTVIQRAASGSFLTAFANINLAQGIYGIEYIAFERSGDCGNELFAAFNPAGTTITSVTQLPFRLVGDRENGGLRVGQSILELAALPEPATLSLGLFGVLALGRRRNRVA